MTKITIEYLNNSDKYQIVNCGIMEFQFETLHEAKFALDVHLKIALKLFRLVVICKPDETVTMRFRPDEGYCSQNNGDCAICPLSSHYYDCHNNKIVKEY